MVVNLAAGLDTRPYRMDLPQQLSWVEVDLPGILDYKEETLAGETSRCQLQRVRLDLSDVSARRELFSDLSGRSKRALILSEGLIIYLTAEAAGSLADDLAHQESFRHWILDIASPGLLKMLLDNYGVAVRRGRRDVEVRSGERTGFLHPARMEGVGGPLHAKDRSGYQAHSCLSRAVRCVSRGPGRHGRTPVVGRLPDG